SWSWSWMSWNPPESGRRSFVVSQTHLRADYGLSRKWRRFELVATEKAGAGVRRKHCQMAARAHQEIQPACRKMRIWIRGMHRLCNYTRADSIPRLLSDTSGFV